MQRGCLVETRCRRLFQGGPRHEGEHQHHPAERVLYNVSDTCLVLLPINVVGTIRCHSLLVYTFGSLVVGWSPSYFFFMDGIYFFYSHLEGNPVGGTQWLSMWRLSMNDVKGQEGLLFVIDLNGVRTVERWCCW